MTWELDLRPSPLASLVVWWLGHSVLTAIQLELVYSNIRTKHQLLILMIATFLWIFVGHFRVVSGVGAFFGIALSGHLFLTTHRRLAVLVGNFQPRSKKAEGTQDSWNRLLIGIPPPIQEVYTQPKDHLSLFRRFVIYQKLLIHQAIGIPWLHPAWRHGSDGIKCGYNRRASLPLLRSIFLKTAGSLVILCVDFVVEDVTKPYAWRVLVFCLEMYCFISTSQEIVKMLLDNVGMIAPDVFGSPLQSNGFADFWSNWNIPVHHALKYSVYVPLRKQGLPRSVCFASVFLISGVWHELLCYSTFGILDGSQVGFFAIQLVCMLFWRTMEHIVPVRMRRYVVIGTLYVMSFVMAQPFLKASAFERLSSWCFDVTNTAGFGTLLE
eukprot:gb/GECG01006508.1/.p1 GENE.gb/GECG01006508.1/~~gb/GECG01006508.1/.p1  ORF type:complete len:381 (+),score=18.87 gb/GECG01006508.1/:1-1143(+)